MTPDLNALGRQLFALRDGAVVVSFAERSFGGWKPREKHCHHNCTDWVEAHPDCKAVRGWLFFDFGYLLPMVRFTSHSVIEQADGTLVDITPSRASQRYPFIRHTGTEDEFADLVDKHGVINLDYQYR